jgi:hypothetical protein
MNRKQLLLLTAAVAALVALVVGYRTIRAEPIGDISRKWEFSGHADRASESFTHWDEDEPPLIPAACAKCHSTYGYLDFLGEDGTAARSVDYAAETGTVLYCNVCHNSSAHAMTAVTFPSSVRVTDLGPEATCMQCHQGRESTDSVDERLAGLPEDVVSDQLGFINVHYAVAAATKWGGWVRGAYQYDGQTYAGFYEHAAQLRMCADCHDPHSLLIDHEACSPCHFNVVAYEDLRDIRNVRPGQDAVDYDGDGDAEEGIAAEIETLHAALYAAIQDYARTVLETPIVYSAGNLPYFMIDTDGDGEADEGEIGFGNRYMDWTPRLVRAAYNYHYVHEDPGQFAHNPPYVLQILYDSLSDLGQRITVEMDAMQRPVP